MSKQLDSILFIETKDLAQAILSKDAVRVVIGSKPQEDDFLRNANPEMIERMIVSTNVVVLGTCYKRHAVTREYKAGKDQCELIKFAVFPMLPNLEDKIEFQWFKEKDKDWQLPLVFHRVVPKCAKALL